METLICNDTIEYIMKTIDFLWKIKHIRPTTEKIYNSIRKEFNDKLDIVECETNIDYLINNGIVVGINCRTDRGKFGRIS